MRYLLPPASRVVKFNIAESADLTSHSIVVAAARGEISLEDANASLGLLERAAEASLAGALAQRLKDLSNQVQSLKSNPQTAAVRTYKTLTVEEALEQGS
jgi:hypothetical protein